MSLNDADLGAFVILRLECGISKEKAAWVRPAPAGGLEIVRVVISRSRAGRAVIPQGERRMKFYRSRTPPQSNPLNGGGAVCPKDVLAAWSSGPAGLSGTAWIAVALGVVIDDAVIGVDNVIARLREAEHNHASDLEAVLNASLEVRGPVIYATLAVIVVLAPLLVLKGQQGALLAPLAAAIIAASLASLIVAAVVTPAFCLLFHQHNGPAPEPRMLTRLKHFHGTLITRLSVRPALIIAATGGGTNARAYRLVRYM